MQINYFYAMQWNKRNAKICKQLKIKYKIILLKTLENGLNKSYFMTYQSLRGILHWKHRVWPQSEERKSKKGLKL